MNFLPAHNPWIPVGAIQNKNKRIFSEARVMNDPKCASVWITIATIMIVAINHPYFGCVIVIVFVIRGKQHMCSCSCARIIIHLNRLDWKWTLAGIFICQLQFMRDELQFFDSVQNGKKNRLWAMSITQHSYTASPQNKTLPFTRKTNFFWLTLIITFQSLLLYIKF